ncbi:MAG: hypothetical protein JWO97_2098, partial [Acidobacteria bacterium]|nr:hypothetical protein [Acidobacteriota bacterium]
PSFIAGGVMSAALWAFGLVSGGWPSFVQLIAGVAIGGVVYLLALWRLDPEIFELAKETLKIPLPPGEGRVRGVADPPGPSSALRAPSPEGEGLP